LSDLPVKIPHSKPLIGEAEIEAVVDVMRRGEIAVGREIEEFECAVAAYIGREHALAVSNGTAAVHMALMALGAGAGDEVILPASVCPGVMHAVEYTGADPVLCDVNLDDLNLSVEAARSAVNSRTKALVLPHLYGIPSDIAALQAMGIPLIEDTAQSFGATYQGRQSGAFGLLSTCSFYATKMLTSGDGGMVLCDDLGLAEKMRAVRYYAGQRDYQRRYNYKMQNISAAIGLVQLGRLDDFLAQRAAQFALLAKAFSGVKGLRVLDGASADKTSAHYKLLLHFEDEDVKARILSLCAEHGLSTGPAIFVDLRAFRAGQVFSDLPNMRKHLYATYSFPIYPGIDISRLNALVDAL
jgi:dTDP-4-amino-4,6-dideoxygalactose transaminase